tara:strand:- start:349 stop:501 length:153 start_codon:yes stop_codon:yes gene_type:complete
MPCPICTATAIFNIVGQGSIATLIASKTLKNKSEKSNTTKSKSSKSKSSK